MYIHICTYNIHIYTQGFAESTKTTFPMLFTRTCCFYKDMLLLKHRSSLKMNIYKQHTSKYTNDHHNCLFTYMQSTPASTESFVCRVIGSLKSVPLRCLTNRATGKSASNQATMVQHVNTAQNGHDLQQLPKHSVCVTVRQASILHSYLIHITVTVDSYQIRNRYILRSYWIQIRHLLIHITVDKFKLDSSYSSFPFILDW